MHERRVAASRLHLQLQLDLLCHAYFTVPLRHQVGTVSLFRDIFLACVVDSSLLYVYLFRAALALSCATCALILHSYQAIESYCCAYTPT